MKTQLPLKQISAGLALASLSPTLALAQGQKTLSLNGTSPNGASPSVLKRDFVKPPDGARPWVYWYFMDGNVSREGIHADLEAMKKAGIGGAIYLEVGIGIPRGPVEFMSPKWQELFAYAVAEAERLGLQIALGTGPGWTGSGGPWVKPELSMQHMVASETTVTGPSRFDGVLPRPKPRSPFFGEGTLEGDLRQQWLDYYQDEVVLAFPTPAKGFRIADTDHKAIYYRSPYSSAPGTPPRIEAPADTSAVPADEAVPATKIITLTTKLGADGHLTWDVPAGNWTIMRFGRTATGQTTRPAPQPGLGFESDKFSKAAVADHLAHYTGALIKTLGPNFRKGESGLTMLHFDSWEMSAQNWSQEFRQEFTKRRGYDPTPFLPSMMGYAVDSPERSERFLWDLRQTASELVVENHAQELKKYAHQRGMTFSVEPYDMNPAGDLVLGEVADLPMGEFWSRGYGFKSEFSVFEAVSIGHTNGRKIIGAESFTADSGDAWLQHPASMKAQLDWALCAGINKFVIHRYQHQPQPGRIPGMTMGPYGVHWEATQTWWDMVPAFHSYMSRTSEMLRQGLPVADILYLTPEGAPEVFTPPASALTGGFPDHQGYSFDGCSPKNLMAKAKVKAGQIVFPDGAAYKVLVLPQWETMTPELLSKIDQLVTAGAIIVGNPPSKSPSLSNYPSSDARVNQLATRLWGKAPYAPSRKVGQGRVIYSALEKAPRVPLVDAQWIWFNEGNPAQSAPDATRYFKTNIQIAAGRKIKSAVASMTADNTFYLSVNSKRVSTGDDFHDIIKTDITALLKPGNNEISVTAINVGPGPGPAGLIGSVDISFADGSHQTVNTNSNWSASQAAQGPWAPAIQMGPLEMGPWGLKSSSATPLYQDYSATARLLSGMGIVPDFASGAPMRFIHRHLSDGDIYFVANSTDQPISTNAIFRTTGFQPEWWNPTKGETRELPNFSMSKKTTTLPVRLAPYESGFVMFRKPSKAVSHAGNNFPVARKLTTLAAPWTVAFNPIWGGPAKVTFPKLEDWSQRPEPGIKYYSGKAVYTTSFDMPATAKLGTGVYGISLGTVKNMASVKVNGKDLGVVWCDPWRVNVPEGVLKPKGNQLEITVANLWTNRLIADSGKPDAEKLTSTTFNPLRPDSPLQPSGLMGPVTLELTAK